jgi:hypothetical protein
MHLVTVSVQDAHGCTGRLLAATMGDTYHDAVADTIAKVHAEPGDWRVVGWHAVSVSDDGTTGPVVADPTHAVELFDSGTSKTIVVFTLDDADNQRVVDDVVYDVCGDGEGGFRQ